jgi:hypothetical protein
LISKVKSQKSKVKKKVLPINLQPATCNLQSATCNLQPSNLQPIFRSEARAKLTPIQNRFTIFRNPNDPFSVGVLAQEQGFVVTVEAGAFFKLYPS